ncbi:hypothetical protein FZ938_01170 [Azospirillum oryzae]|nr:hypothetical protein FZ938_01170 [Azospirillum oryzae]
MDRFVNRRIRCQTRTLDGRHPREGGDPGFQIKRLMRLDSRLRGNDGRKGTAPKPMNRSSYFFICVRLKFSCSGVSWKPR